MYRVFVGVRLCALAAHELVWADGSSSSWLHEYFVVD